MIRFISLLMTFFMFSCYSVISEFTEHEEILDYAYYINQGWQAFEESVNLSDLSDTLSIAQRSEYYNLAFTMFNVAIESIQSEFLNQVSIGPYYQAYNGIGWSQLYYAGDFLDDNIKRDSLRNEAITSFELAYNDLNESEFDGILYQDWCNMYAGLFYTNYYLGLEDTSYFDLSLEYSEALLSIKPLYDFNHDELDYRNIHYLRGKIYLRQQLYDQAYDEIKVIVEDCNPYVGNTDQIDINILFSCFDQFSNNN